MHRINIVVNNMLLKVTVINPSALCFVVFVVGLVLEVVEDPHRRL